MRAIVCAVLLSLASACAATGPTRAATACVLATPPQVITVADPSPDELHELFELKDTPEWWAPAPVDGARARYQAALVARLGDAKAVEPLALLARQRAVHAGLPGELSREAENIDALTRGEVGRIGPATCLEWLLFARQAARFPMLERPTEFSAYVLRGQGRLRVYMSGADRVGGRLRGEVSDRVVTDVAAGYAPVAHLHNHPFMFDRTPGDRTWATAENMQDIAGALAPSLTDVQLYRAMRAHFGLLGAWVTNGLDTARYSAADFDRLSAWPPTEAK